MDNNGQQWATMDNDGHQWATMDINGQQWETMVNNGQQWTTMGNDGQQWTIIRGATCICDAVFIFTTPPLTFKTQEKLILSFSFQFKLVVDTSLQGGKTGPDFN